MFQIELDKTEFHCAFAVLVYKQNWSCTSIVTTVSFKLSIKSNKAYLCDFCVDQQDGLKTLRDSKTLVFSKIVPQNLKEFAKISQLQSKTNHNIKLKNTYF